MSASRSFVPAWWLPGRHAQTVWGQVGRYHPRWFLPTLREKMQHVADRFPEVRARIDLEAACRAVDFGPFDHVATAPMHGFDGAEDYYRQCSSIHFVERIRTPTLCLSARDDPFLPARVLERLHERRPPTLRLEVTREGGHVGWVSGAHPRRAHYWAEEYIIEWLAAGLRELRADAPPETKAARGEKGSVRDRSRGER